MPNLAPGFMFNISRYLSKEYICESQTTYIITNPILSLHHAEKIASLPPNQLKQKKIFTKIHRHKEGKPRVNASVQI